MDVVNEALVDAFAALYAALPDATVERRDGYALLSYPHAPLPSFNGVWTWTDGPEIVAALEPQLAALRADGLQPGVMMLGELAAVRAEAQRLGLTESERIPGMLLHRESFRPQATRAEFDLDALDDARALVGDAFDIPLEWFRSMYTRRVLDRIPARVYTLYADGEAVSTVLATARGEGAGIFNVATRASRRSRGYGGAVTSRALEDAFAEGAAFAFLQSSGLGESVYRALGFEHVNTYALAYEPHQ